MKILVLFIVLGVSQASQRIFGGRYAASWEIPYQASLQTELRGRSFTFCGGSLIHRQWVLTAAHCLVPGYPDMTVMLDGTDLGNPASWMYRNRAFSTLVHEGYNRETMVNDIAMINIPDAPNWIPTAELAPVNFGSLVNAQVRASGFGWTNRDPNSGSPYLKSATLRVMDNRQCRSTFRITGAQVCTTWDQQAGETTCRGDSGSPLVYRGAGHDIQVGITSFGSKECNDAPAVFTRVSWYRSWIDAVIRAYTRY